jgi:hypothetical protein
MKFAAFATKETKSVVMRPLDNEIERKWEILACSLPVGMD